MAQKTPDYSAFLWDSDDETLEDLTSGKMTNNKQVQDVWDRFAEEIAKSDTYVPDPQWSRPAPAEWLDENDGLIRDKIRPVPMLGTIVFADTKNQVYYLDYRHWDKHKGVCFFTPQPPTGYEGWKNVYPAKIQRWEAELRRKRFGKHLRDVARLALYNSKGYRELHGGNIAQLIELMLADFEKREPEYPISTPRSNQIHDAIQELCEWGYLNVFTNINKSQYIGTDNPTSWLLVPTPFLLDQRTMLERGHPEFARNPMSELQQLDKLIQLEFNHDDTIHQKEFPYIKAVDFGTGAHMEAVNWSYELLNAGERFDLPVVPEEKNYPNQPAHVVLRGVPSGGEFREQTGLVELMSEIAAESIVVEYLNDGEGQRAAMKELFLCTEPTNPFHVTESLNLLTDDDLVAVLKYAECFLSEAAQRDVEKIKLKKNGVELVQEVLEMVPSRGMKRRHVLKQIHLLVAEILQHCIAAWSGKIAGSFPPTPEPHE